jgi:hypothetical protein
MTQLEVVLEPGVGVSPADLAAAWESDEEARATGPASVRTAPPDGFFGVLELVIVPLAVNLASSAITALVGKLIARLRTGEPEAPALEIVEMTRPNGDRIVVVRLSELPK